MLRRGVLLNCSVHASVHVLLFQAQHSDLLDPTSMIKATVETLMKDNPYERHQTVKTTYLKIHCLLIKHEFIPH